MAPHAESPARSPALSAEPHLVDDEPYYYGTDAVTDAQRYPESGISVLVIGGGLGGLMAAMECWRKGHLVRIVERNSKPILTGDTLSIGPPVMPIFRHWPELSKEVEEIDLHFYLRYFDASGEFIYGPTEIPWNDPDQKEGRKGPRVAFMQNRGKFYEMLLKQVQRLGILIEWGNPAVEYFEDEKPGKAGKGGVILQNGETRVADVVIAADGINTRAGKIIRGYDMEPRDSGSAIFRTGYDGKLAWENPTVRAKWQLPEDGRPIWDFYMGKGMHAVTGLSKDFVSWAVTHQDDGTAMEDWKPDVSPEEVLSTMGKGWDPALEALFSTAPKGNIVHWKIMWRDLSDKWVSPHGRVVQLGDAVHSFLPTSGNGATQALEDAITLATCLQLGGKSQIGNAARVYNKLRYERVACVQKLSFVNKVNIQKANIEALKEHPEKARTKQPRWINQHDPEQYAYEKYGLAYNHVVMGAPFENTNIPPGHTPTPLPLDDALKMIERGESFDLDGDWS